jgi:hypothetical protein
VLTDIPVKCAAIGTKSLLQQPFSPHWWPMPEGQVASCFVIPALNQLADTPPRLSQVLILDAKDLREIHGFDEALGLGLVHWGFRCYSNVSYSMHRV